MKSKKKDLEIIKFILQEQEDETEKVETFEDNPMEFILRKYKTLDEVMTELMTPSYREYLDAVFIVAPKPTTFKIVLHNGQFFYLTYLGKVYEATVAGKKYYLSNIGEKERCMLAISRILRGGNPLKSKGPEGAEQGTRDGGGSASGGGGFGGSEGGAETGGGEEGGAEAGGGEGEEGGEELKETFLMESKIVEALLKKDQKKLKEAYTDFPKSEKEISDKNVKSLFKALKTVTDVEDPIALNPDNLTSIKITRKLQGDKKALSAIQKLTGQDISKTGKVKWNNLNISFGEGSRGGRGVKSKGLGFEGSLFSDLEKLYKEGLTSKNQDSFNNTELIKEIAREFGLEKGNFRATLDGSQNKPRPLIFTPKGPEISFSGDSAAETLTDITIYKEDRTAYYISAKFGGTVTFFNSGVSKVLPASEIEKGQIKNENGIALLKALGIDNKSFCEVFNAYAKGKEGNFVPKKIKADIPKLENLISSGIGYGYYYTQSGKGKNQFFKIDKKYNKKASTIVSEPVVYYGGIDGKSKRVDIVFESEKYIFKVNIRNKQGGLYPTHIMCDYKEK